MVNSLPNIGGGKAARRENFRARAEIVEGTGSENFRVPFFHEMVEIFFLSY
jgi:hypothetical protein